MTAGTKRATPVPMATVRGKTPASIVIPAIQLAAARTSIETASSAPKTRPRNRSSVFKCNRVVENTQTVEVPACASTITANAAHTSAHVSQQQISDRRPPENPPAPPASGWAPAVLSNEKRTAARVAHPTPRPPISRLIPNSPARCGEIPAIATGNTRSPITGSNTHDAPRMLTPAFSETSAASLGSCAMYRNPARIGDHPAPWSSGCRFASSACDSTKSCG